MDCRKSFAAICSGPARRRSELGSKAWQRCERIGGTVGKVSWVRRLRTLPGIGEILGPTIYLEIGRVSRFATAANLAAYAGLVQRVISSGGHTRLGRTRRECNRFLKWAFVEAAEVIVAHQESRGARPVVRLYRRVRSNKPERHNKAVVAVARHLAESASRGPVWARLPTTYRASLRPSANRCVGDSVVV